MGGVEAVGNFDGEIQELIERERLTGNVVLKRGAFHQFHGDEGAAAVFRYLVDGADVRMIQRGGCAGFPAEALQGLGILGQIFGKKFKRDIPAEIYVFRFIDHTHTTASKLRNDAVVRDGLPNERLWIRHWRNLRAGQESSQRRRTVVARLAQVFGEGAWR